MHILARRGPAGWLVILLLAALAIVPGLRPFPVAAQVSVDCAAPATPAAATPAAPAASPVAASPVAFPQRGGEVTVFAAASLTDAFGKIKSDLEAANPGLTITYNFAGSQALVTQLKEGATADVFASANKTQMTAATDNGSISGTPATFVRNKLAIVVPIDNPAGIAAPVDLGNEGLKLVVAQADVPVGKYARESLCTMGRDTATYGEGFVDRVAGNIVSEEEDVRDVLAKVELGEADAGIVYLTDAASAPDQVKVVEIPAGVNVVASYPIAPVTGGTTDLASAFIAYVLGPEGQATLKTFGFEPVAS